MWLNHKFFKYLAGILLILLVIFMFGKIGYFLLPFQKLFATLSIPIIATSIFYYILRPLVRLLITYKVPRVLAIIISYFVVIGVFALMSSLTGSIIREQFNQLMNDLPKIFEMARSKTNDFINTPWFRDLQIENYQQKAVDFLGKATQSLSSFVFNMIQTITNIGTLLFLVPFILFYFLKDDRHFVDNALHIVPNRYEKNVKKILKDIDMALSSYIVGQMTVALAIGILMFIGYLIVDLKYSLILAIFAMLTCIIPFFGPWIGIIPALLIALTISPLMVVKVLFIMLFVQQIDNNFISPTVMGKRLDIHPVTVIFLLLSGISLYGFIGLLLAIPSYAAIKATVKNIYNMYLFKYVDMD